MTPIAGVAEFVAQPTGAVVGALDNAHHVWMHAIRYPQCWKLVGYNATLSDSDAWAMLADGSKGAAQLYVDEPLAHRPPAQASAIVAGDRERAERIRVRTEGMAVGWYVTTGFFGDDVDPLIVDGPISQFDTARARRAEIETRTAGPILYLDCVEPVPSGTPSSRAGNVR